MPTLAQQAELEKLARLLDQPPDHLAFLSSLEAGSVRSLREQASAVLFDANRAAMQRAADASRLMPGSLLALLAKKALGPMLCARIAGLMPTDKAMDIAGKLDTRFLAQLCLELDPRRARPLIAAMPPARVAEIAGALAAQREFITMARFVDALSPAAIKAVLKSLTDDEAILRIAFYVEDKTKLDDIARLLPDTRLAAIVKRSALDTDLWPEGLALMNELGPEQRQRIADLSAAQEQPVIEAMVRATAAQDLWPLLLPVVAQMGESGQKRIALLAEAWDDKLLLTVARAAHAANQWAHLVGLFTHLREEAKPRLRTLAEQLTPEQARALQALVREKDLWGKLGEIKDVLSRLG